MDGEQATRLCGPNRKPIMHGSIRTERRNLGAGENSGCIGRFMAALGAAAFLSSVSPAAGQLVDLTARLLPEDAKDARFGLSIAMHSSVAAVGAAGDNTVDLIDAATGHRLFKLHGDDSFGRKVDLDGSTVVVGTPWDDGYGAYAGSAHLFDVATGQQIATLLTGDAYARDYFGCAAAVDGPFAVVGAFGDDDNGSQSGSAYLFDAGSGARIAKLLPDDGARDEDFGWAVDVAGSIAIIGAPGEHDNGDTSGWAYLFDLSTGTQQAKLAPDDGEPYDHFGCSVAIDGSTAVIGAWGDDDRGVNSGSAYLFDISTGQQIAKLLPADGKAEDRFGFCVAIEGSIAVVGSPYNDANGNFSGAAYLFDSATGEQLAKLLPDDGAADDWFGISVGVNGNTVLIGAAGNNDCGHEAGSAYLFDTTTGEQTRKLLPSDNPLNDHFGCAVDLDESTAIVGAADDRDAGWGSAYLFELPTHYAAKPDARLVPDDDAPEFGCAVALNGLRAIVGARGDDDRGLESGSAFLFSATTGEQIRKLLPDDGAAFDHFGAAVDIDGATAVVGAPDDSDNGQHSGSAYLFDVDTGAQIAKLLPDDGAAGDALGWTVAVDDARALVGAPGHDGAGLDAGAAYLFDAATGELITVLLPDDGEAGDSFGCAVGIDGAIAVVGADGDDDNGTDGGSVYLFDLTSGAQIAKILPDDGEAGDHFGHSLAVDADLVIVGAAWEDDNGQRAGSAYLFDLTTLALIDKVLPTGATGNDEFGYAVGLAGSYLMFGAPQHDGNAADSGAAYFGILKQVPDGDLTGDGCVDQRDLGILLVAFNNYNDPAGDIDGDGDTDASDLGILLANYGDGC
jgi:FG-GAP repeat